MRKYIKVIVRREKGIVLTLNKIEEDNKIFFDVSCEGADFFVTSPTFRNIEDCFYWFKPEAFYIF